MKRRILSLLLVVCLSVLCVGATSMAAEARASAMLSGGLLSNGGSSYQLYGKIRGTSGDAKTVRAELYLGNTYITSTSTVSGTASIVTATTNVTLSTGTYRVDVYGTTSTEPSLSYSTYVSVS